jgi:hypothetical protein
LVVYCLNYRNSLKLLIKGRKTMINQITNFFVTAKLGLFFNPSRSQFEFLKKKYLILTNLETGPYKGGGKVRGDDI